MIIMPYRKHIAAGVSKRVKAGDEAENQMAHYLHRSFEKSSEVFVLHGLRLKDDKQLEHDGSVGICQIDHLVVHRWGMFIVESKSVSEEVCVRSDGAGGDEWSRSYRGRDKGMASPILQAGRQSAFLRSVLHRNREELLGRHQFGLRTLAKLQTGTDQRGFRSVPVQLVVAISDKGRIRRLSGWREPEKPFRVFVAKADEVPRKIENEVARHKAASRLLFGAEDGEYGLWRMEKSEVIEVAKFLAGQNVDVWRGGDVRSSGGEAVGRSMKASDVVNEGDGFNVCCTDCGVAYSEAYYNRGYYWKCSMCGVTKNMPVVCSSCGTKGKGGKLVRISKKGNYYSRVCEECECVEVIWSKVG